MDGRVSEAKTSRWSVVKRGVPKVKPSAVGDGIVAQNARWSFDGISGSFTEHARRSIPFYDEGHDLICRYSDYFVTTSSVVYDIGTTTGLLAHKLADWNKSKTSSSYAPTQSPSIMKQRACSRATTWCNSITRMCVRR